jgi:predicted ATP-grasp superfamily ATP-dependent carboligase
MVPVLVTDGEQRAALAVVRSLGRAGYEPYVCSARHRSLAGGSRSARGEALVPDPLRSPAEYVESVKELVAAWDIEVLLPITEASLLALLPARDEFGIKLAAPDLPSFLSVSDKGRLLRLAEEEGIAVPRQLRLAVREEAESVLAEAPAFPLVIKPSRSISGVAERGNDRVQLSVSYAATPAELVTRLAALPDAAYPVLLQQRIVGPGVGVFLLLWDGELLASFSHRRLRENPPSGGGSVYSESISMDPGLLDRSRRLLDRFDWTGPAMVEYKMDTRTGIPYLMEVNGRFWGSLQLAIDAGVDFPALLLAAVRGEPRSGVHHYRTGVRLRWWWGDVEHLIARLRGSPASLALPDDAPGRLHLIRDFLRIWRAGERNEVFRLRDPGPLIRETRDWFQRR